MDQLRATVQVKVGNHADQSCPQGMATFIEDKMTEAGVLCPCKVRLGRALRASGGTTGDFHAIRVEHGEVVIAAQCGNNETRRILRLSCENLTPEEVFEKLEATFGKMIESDEGKDENPPFTPTPPWFPTDETALRRYLIKLEPLLRQPKGCLHSDAVQCVRRVTPKTGRNKNQTYDQILQHLIDQGLLNFDESGKGKGWRRYYRLTENGEAVLAPSTATAPIPPTPAAPIPAPTKNTPSLLERARQVAEKKLREATEIEALAASIEPAKPVIDRLRVLRREAEELEKNLAAKKSEIEELEASLTSEVLQGYNQLKELLRLEPNIADTNGGNI